MAVRKFFPYQRITHQESHEYATEFEEYEEQDEKWYILKKFEYDITPYTDIANNMVRAEIIELKGTERNSKNLKKTVSGSKTYLELEESLDFKNLKPGADSVYVSIYISGAGGMYIGHIEGIPLKASGEPENWLTPVSKSKEDTNNRLWKIDYDDDDGNVFIILAEADEGIEGFYEHFRDANSSTSGLILQEIFYDLCYQYLTTHEDNDEEKWMDVKETKQVSNVY